MAIIRKLATEILRKVGAENKHRRTQNSLKKSICAGLLQRSEKDGNAFLPRITDEQNWVHHYDQLENTVNGMASSGVATQEQMEGTDFC
jgi:hypothetical protein